MKLVTFAGDTTVFLRYITCLKRMQAILKLFEEASISNIKFSKSQTQQAGAYENRTKKPVQMRWPQV